MKKKYSDMQKFYGISVYINRGWTDNNTMIWPGEKSKTIFFTVSKLLWSLV